MGGVDGEVPDHSLGTTPFEDVRGFSDVRVAEVVELLIKKILDQHIVCLSTFFY